MGEQKENFDDRCVNPCNLQLFLSRLTNNRVLYSVSSRIISTKTKNGPQTLRYFALGKRNSFKSSQFL